MRVGRKRVARLVSQNCLAGVSRRKFVVTTVKSDSRQAPDLVERDFTASVPDRLWVADITYVPDLGGVSLSRGGARRPPPPHRWLVEGHHARHTTGARCSEHGAHMTGRP